MVNFAEIKRFVSYFAVAMVSVMSIFGMLVLEFPPFIAVFFGFFVSLAISFAAFISSGNAFTRIVSGAEYGVLIFGSTGHLRFYTAKIQGDKFVSQIDGVSIEQKFNRNLFWYVSKKITEGILRQKEVKPGIDATGKPVSREGNEVVFEAPVENKNISSELFKTDYPFLIYNPSIKSFITKEWLFHKEYDSMFFNFGWELKQSIDLHNQAASNITRKILDLIALKSRDPQTKTFIMLFAGGIIILLAVVLFGEPVFEFLDAFLADPANAKDIILSDKLT